MYPRKAPLRNPGPPRGHDEGRPMRRIVTLVALAAVIAGQLVALQGQGLAHAQTRELATKGVLLDRVAAVVNAGVVLNSELDDQEATISERLKSQKLELPPANV